METATGGRMVTLAEADLEESATEVAVTLTCAGFGTEPGAAYKPLDETVPHAAPEQPVPLTVQVTSVFVVFTTVAVNCCVLLATIWALVGEMLTAMGGRMVIVAEPDFSGFATDVAVTVTTAGFGTEAGALYTPDDVMMPHAASEQPLPDKLQLTAVLVAPVTVAVNNCCWLTTMLVAAGETETAALSAVPTKTLALADTLRSARDVAVTTTIGGVGAV